MASLQIDEFDFLGDGTVLQDALKVYIKEKFKTHLEAARKDAIAGINAVYDEAIMQASGELLANLTSRSKSMSTYETILNISVNGGPGKKVKMKKTIIDEPDYGSF